MADDNINYNPTPKQVKQEQDELKSFDWAEVDENEVEINLQIDQLKEDKLGW
tara:strand:+ start:35688 stop:35843 length:156 start_codon:yes stop_codon:yes gene_type:complete